MIESVLLFFSAPFSDGRFPVAFTLGGVADICGHWSFDRQL